MHRKQKFFTPFLEKSFPAVRAGFTLLEVLIALSIFAIATTGVLRSFVFCNSRAKSTALRIAAIARVQEVVEEIESDAYGDVTSANYPGGVITLDTVGTTATADDRTAIRTIAISGAAPAPLTVTVTVNWSFQGNEFSESLLALKD